MKWRGVTLLRRDIHALEALRVDRFLHHGGPFCFIDECRECSLRAQQFGCVTHDGRAQRDTDDLTTPERPEGTEYSEVPPEEAR